jgi:uncharacterized protein (TIGR02588 family)
MEKEKDEAKNQNRGTTPALEWLAAAIGFLLVVGTIGFLVYDALTEKDTPPQINVEVKEIIQQEKGFLVKFEVENKGDNHASEVEVEGKLMQGEKEKESSTVGIGYAPSHSKKSGGLYFTENPREYQLKLRVPGYNEP